MNAILVRTNARSIVLHLFAAALVVLIATSAAQAQISNLQDIIQNLLQTGGQTTTPTQTTTQTPTQTTTGTGSTTEDGMPTTPPTGTRQGTITNQFTASSAGAIQARRPGLWLQQATAINGGDTSFFTGVPEEQPNFFVDTFNQIFTQMTTVIQGLLDGINTFVQNTLKPGGTTGTGGGTAFTPATTGQGTQNPIQ